MPRIIDECRVPTALSAIAVPDLLLAPYVVVSAPVTVGPWELVPFREFQQDADESEGESREWVSEAVRNPVMRLVEAYRLEPGIAALGAVVVPKGGRAGDPFDRALMTRLGHALLAGSVADNPLMTLPEEEQSLYAGHEGATSENALLYGHPLGGGESYVIQTGVLFKVTSYRRAPDDESLPKVEPPVELPRPIFGNFDEEVADAAHGLLSSSNAQARRFHRALDWYRIALSNAEAVTLDVRVGATRSAIEVLTGQSDETKKVVRAYGRLMRTDETTEERVSSTLSGQQAVRRDHNVLLGAGSRPLDRRSEVVQFPRGLKPAASATAVSAHRAGLHGATPLRCKRAEPKCSLAALIRRQPATRSAEAPYFGRVDLRRLRQSADR